jgi:hypothetical protein
MTDSEKEGQKLAVVQVLTVFAGLELLGGVLAMIDASKQTITGINPGTFDVTYSSEHDWTLGLVYLAASIFIAAVLMGFVHIIQDVHDTKRAMESVAARSVGSAGRHEGSTLPGEGPTSQGEGNRWDVPPVPQ